MVIHASLQYNRWQLSSLVLSFPEGSNLQIYWQYLNHVYQRKIEMPESACLFNAI